MALIERNSIMDFSVNAALKADNRVTLEAFSAQEDLHCISALEKIKTIREMEQITRRSDAEAFMLRRSAQTASVYLESIELTKDFDAFGPFRTRNEIYLISTAFDLSGSPVYLYPNSTVPQHDFINSTFSVRRNQRYSFLSAGYAPYGFPLFPERYVTGGLSIQLKIFESDQDIRGSTYTKLVSDLEDLLNKGGIIALLGLLKPVPVIGQIQIIMSVLAQFSTKVGEVLKSNSDDFVDMFTINLGIDDLNAVDTWPRSFEGQGCRVVLNLKSTTGSSDVVYK